MTTILFDNANKEPLLIEVANGADINVNPNTVIGLEFQDNDKIEIINNNHIAVQSVKRPIIISQTKTENNK